MARAKNLIEKEPVTSGKATSSSESLSSSSNQDNHNILDDDMSTLRREKIAKLDKQMGRHFWYVVYPTKEYYEQYYEEHKYDDAEIDKETGELIPRKHYEGGEGYGTAPDDWIEQLRQTGLAFCVSPMHDRDEAYSEDLRKLVPKKPHWHVIVSWGNSTTYRNARSLCDLLKSPMPELLKKVTAAYRYHNHKDDPDKYQYEETSRTFNGWERPLESQEVARLKEEIRHIIYMDDCIEYGELLEVLHGYGSEYVDVGTHNTFLFTKICSSYRHNPVRCLSRYKSQLDPEADVETIKLIEERIKHFIARRKKKENDYESNDYERMY